jgi:hypothetical protein
MSRLLARAFFVLQPAVLCGGAMAYFHQPLGVAAFAALIGLGLSATRTRPERGER